MPHTGFHFLCCARLFSLPFLLVATLIGSHPSIAQNPIDQGQLEPGKQVSAELSSGASNLHRLGLSANQFINIQIVPKALDYDASIIDSEGKQNLKQASSSGRDDIINLVLISTQSGTYQIIVHAPEGKSTKGSYEIKVVDLRPATPFDQVIAESFKNSIAAQNLRTQKKEAEASALEIQAINSIDQKLKDGTANLSTLSNNLIEWYTDVICSQAKTAYKNGHYNEAIDGYQRAVGILEERFAKDSLETLIPLNEIAVIYLTKGEILKAEQLFQRILDVRQKKLPPTDVNIAISLTNLGAVLYSEGDYVRAEKIFQQANSAWETLKSGNVTFAMNGLALLSMERGDYDRAENLWQEILKGIEATAKEPGLSQAIMQSNLAGLYYRKGDLNQAEIYQNRALAIRQKVLSPEHSEVAISLNLLGDIYYRKGDQVKAQDYYQQALTILKKTVDTDHPNIAYSYNRLALISENRGDYQKAESLYQDALKIRKKTMGDKHPEVSESLGELAWLYRKMGDSGKALQFQILTNETNEAALRRNLTVGSERQIQIYLSLFSTAINNALSLQAQEMPENKEAARMALETVLRNKGRSLDAMTNSIATFRSHAKPEQQVLFDRLLAMRTQLANLTFRGLGNDSPAIYQTKLKQIEIEIESLESDLSRRNAEFQSDWQPATLKAVQAAIPANHRLIEFATFRPYDTAKKSFGAEHYLVYVLNSSGEIQWKDLGDSRTIDASIEALRQALRDPKRDDVNLLSRKVDTRVMQPIRAMIGETQNLLISPDGMLNLLPFAALLDEQSHFLVEKYTISYLTSGRDLLRWQIARSPQSNAMIVADPDFDLKPKSEVIAQNRRPANDQLATVRGMKSGDDNFREWSADRLYETAREAQAIKSFLSQPTVLMQEKATKIAIQQVQAPEILHIATHGFFLDNKKQSNSSSDISKNIDSSLAFTQSKDLLTPQIKDPLLRSGLLLAGFNQHRDSDDNGVLTAKEAAGLNLWGTRMVVLSACDTGVGDVRNGDGVYGLRRALVLAGSETQVMSFWPVSDVVSREWMTDFYSQLKDGQGRSEAVRQVQLRMMARKNRQHPFYWASFMQSGKWTKLEEK